MNGTLAARLFRTGLALLLGLTMAAAVFAGSVNPISAQGDASVQLPGFDALPTEAELLAFAAGQFEGEGVATLQVERIAIEPGAALDLVAGPFIVMIEQGSLSYEDDLGLEAQISAGDSQYFAPGEGDSLVNNGSETAVILRTSLITDAPINGDAGPEDGGDGASDTTADDAEVDDSAADEPVAIEISAVDIAFEQTEIEAPANTDFTITLTNNGNAVHGFVIEDTDFRTTLLVGGDSDTITVNLPAGEYTFYCPVPGHREAGMEGTLIVSEDGGATVAPDDNTSDDDDSGPGEDTPIDPREDPQGGATSPSAGGVNALILQPTTAPDEVVISLTEAGFTPDTFEIARGGALVIENAGETSCEFEIADLDVALELDAGDIEQITIDGPVGDYDLLCTSAGNDVLGEAVLTIVDESGQDEPVEDATPAPVDDATPEPAVDATPTPEVTENIESDDVTEFGPTGVLFQTSVSLGGDGELFSATLTLQPGGVLSLNGADGLLGVMVYGGDLTVVRPGRAIAMLRDGRSVILPSGTAAEMANMGDTPLTLLIAGVTGSSAAPDAEDAETPESGNADQTESGSGDSGSSDSGGESLGAYALFPDDSELEELGLYPTSIAFTEISDPASNNFWFSLADEAEASFTEWNWVRSSELRYSSNGEETEYGEVVVLGIIVDTFEDDAGAADFYDFIANETYSDGVDFLVGADEVESAVAFTFTDPDSNTMIVAIHTGTYVITLFTTGPNVDAEALLADVASLIFGVVG